MKVNRFVVISPLNLLISAWFQRLSAEFIMSSRRGESTRQRPQKYQNTRAYKNDLHDKTPMTKKLNSLQIHGVCERCKSILEWKIKYKKFKPAKAPGHCTKCLQKCVKHAYHIMCQPCAAKENVCPKCGKNEELVIGKPSPQEEMKLDQEMQAMLKSLPERKRRTFLRYMEKNSPGGKKGKKKEKPSGEGDKIKECSNVESQGDDCSIDGENEECEVKYLTKKDIMAKLEALKLSVKDDSDFDDDFGNDFGDSDDFSDDDS